MKLIGWNDSKATFRLSQSLKARAQREARKGNVEEAKRCFDKAAAYAARTVELVVR